MAMTIIENPKEQDGATSDAVRESFEKWSDFEDVDDLSISYWVECQRVRFRLFVDEASLKSIVEASLVPRHSTTHDQADGGFINFPRKKWESHDREEWCIRYAPIEGITCKDVGWMRIPLSAIVHLYTLFRDKAFWRTEYPRPPGWHDGH